jgi:hypothetical protein
MAVLTPNEATRMTDWLKLNTGVVGAIEVLNLSCFPCAHMSLASEAAAARLSTAVTFPCGLRACGADVPPETVGLAGELLKRGDSGRQVRPAISSKTERMTSTRFFTLINLSQTLACRYVL